MCVGERILHIYVWSMPPSFTGRMCFYTEFNENLRSDDTMFNIIILYLVNECNSVGFASESKG